MKSGARTVIYWLSAPRSFFIRAVSKLNELDVVYFKAKDANKVKVVSWDNRYGGYNENRIFCTIEYILRELESQRPNYKP